MTSSYELSFSDPWPQGKSQQSPRRLGTCREYKHIRALLMVITHLNNIKTLVMVTLNTCVSEHSEQPAALSAQTGARLQPLDCSYSRVPSSLEVSVSPGAAATGLRLGTEISKPVHECKLSSIICKYCMIKMT